MTGFLTLICALFLLSQVSLVIAQQQSCIILDEKNICGADFVGYPVKESFFKTNEAFNTFIQENFVNNITVIKKFETSHGCNPTALVQGVRTLRYQVSFWCSNIVKDAMNSGCKPSATSQRPPGGPLPCPDVCTTFAQSVETMLKNVTFCPTNNVPQNTQANRANLISSIRQFCTATSEELKKNGDNQCTFGSPTDVTSCGFANERDANNFCPSLTEDKCCTQFLKARSMIPTSIVSSGLSVGAIIGIVLAILGAIAMVTLYMVRRKRTKRTPPTSISSAGNGHSPSKVGTPMGSPKMTLDNPNKLAYFENARTTTVSMGAILPSGHSKLAAAKVTTTTLNDTSSYETPETPVIDFSHSDKYITIHAYEATMEDELKLEIGDEVLIAKSFDDGWGVGENVRTGKKGAIPLVCVKRIGEESSGHDRTEPPRISKRVSSYAPSRYTTTSTAEPENMFKHVSTATTIKTQF